MAKGESRRRAYELWKSSNGEISLREIADKLGVSPSKIRKWKSLDKWNAPPEKVERSTSKRVEHPTRKTRPKSDNFGVDNAFEKVERSTSDKQNLKNNLGGAPLRNQNAYKTGEYAAFMEEFLDDDERNFIRMDLPSPLAVLRIVSR